MRSLVLVVAAATGGRVTESRPESCEPATVELVTSLDTESLEPSDLAVCRDQEVTLIVDSAVDGVLHIHGYDSELPAFGVTAGEETSVTFTAGRSGQFSIALHAAEDRRGHGRHPHRA